MSLRRQIGTEEWMQRVMAVPGLRLVSYVSWVGAADRAHGLGAVAVPRPQPDSSVLAQERQPAEGLLMERRPLPRTFDRGGK